MSSKTKDTMVKRLGSEEAYKQHMRDIRKRVRKPGFASMDKEKLRQIAIKAQKLSVESRRNNAPSRRNKSSNNASKEI